MIFRIVHRDNLPWIFDHGLHASTRDIFDPNYKAIGNPELIEKRSRRPVPVPPGGFLGDYVPFYFTPYSIMMFNIKTGYGGVSKVANDEIVILVSSLSHIAARGIPIVFTDQHAYPMAGGILHRSDGFEPNRLAVVAEPGFQDGPRKTPARRNDIRPKRSIWRHVPLDALLGVSCYSQTS